MLHDLLAIARRSPGVVALISVSVALAWLLLYLNSKEAPTFQDFSTSERQLLSAGQATPRDFTPAEEQAALTVIEQDPTVRQMIGNRRYQVEAMLTTTSPSGACLEVRCARLLISVFDATGERQWLHASVDMSGQSPRLLEVEWSQPGEGATCGCG